MKYFIQLVGTLLMAVVLIVILFGKTASAQLTVVNNTPDAIAHEYSFIDDAIGYARMTKSDFAEPHFINKTINGGQSWTVIPNPAGQAALSAINFTSDQVGYILTRETNTVSPVSVYKTTDDGANWSNITPTAQGLPWPGAAGDPVPLFQFVNDQVGFILTPTANYYYKTVDGGTNWDTVQISTAQFQDVSVRDMHFFDADHGIIGLFDNTFLYRGGVYTTSDGGQTWQGFIFPVLYGVIGSVKFTSVTTAYAAPIGWGSGGLPQLYKTTDSGISWDTLDLPLPSTVPTGNVFTAFDFRTENEGYAIINNTESDVRHFYQTKDGGDSWVPFGTTSVSDLTELHLTANKGFASGDTNAFVRLDLPIGITEPVNVNMNLYPNPVAAGGSLHLEFEDTSPRQISLLSIDGKLIQQTSLTGMSVNFEVPASLEAGCYMLRMQDGERSNTMRIVIQ